MDLIERLRAVAARTNDPLLTEAAAALEATREDVKRLQEIVRPKREDECLTLDHWRMRAYDLEANWSRCSRACAGEQAKREQAEALVEKLREEREIIGAEAIKYADKSGRLEAKVDQLAEALRWYVENDDTNEGQEGNEYWLAGRNRAIAVLARAAQHQEPTT